MQYKEDKGVNDAACLPEGGPAEDGVLMVSSLPILDGARTDGLAGICYCFPQDRVWYKINDPKVDYSGGLREGKVGH